MKDHSKLSEKEKELLRRKLLHGGGLTLSQIRIHFTDTERLILSSAESKAEKKRKIKKEK